MKEIRKETLEQKNRRQLRQEKAAMRKFEKAPKYPIPFQLPGELAPSLRKLRVRSIQLHNILELKYISVAVLVVCYNPAPVCSINFSWIRVNKGN